LACVCVCVWVCWDTYAISLTRPSFLSPGIWELVVHVSEQQGYSCLPPCPRCPPTRVRALRVRWPTFGLRETTYDPGETQSTWPVGQTDTSPLMSLSVPNMQPKRQTVARCIAFLLDSGEIRWRTYAIFLKFVVRHAGGHRIRPMRCALLA
jgi:hypothetical protein